VDAACMVRVGGGDLTAAYAGFEQSCGPGRADGGVDFVGFGLAPSSQQQWAATAAGDPRAYFGVRADGTGEGAGSATAFLHTTDLSSCGSWCGHVWSWASSLPDVAPFAQGAGMQAFAKDCAAMGPQCDPHDPHAQAGYTAVQLAAAALRGIGPAVTRSALRAYLASAAFDDGVLLPLHFQGGTHQGAQEIRPVVAETYDQSGNPQSFGWAAPGATDPCPRCADPPAA
jgi:hypothetical protein